MKHISWLLFYIFIFLIEETVFSLFDIKNITFGKSSLLSYIWSALGILLIILYIITYINRSKYIKDAKQMLSNKRPSQTKLIKYFNLISKYRDNWKKYNSYYYNELLKILKFLIPAKSSLIEIGCGTGDFLKQIPCEKSMGIDISPEMIEKARQKYPDITFSIMNAENIIPAKLCGPYDYILMSDIVGHLNDIQKSIEETKKVMHDDSKLIITYYNYLWEPILIFLEKLYLKMPQFRQNWLSMSDLKNLIELSGLEVVKNGTGLLIPMYIPFFSWIFNKYLVKLPFLKAFGIIQYLVARRNDLEPQEYSVSVIIPARNEAGNIEDAVLRTPKMGSRTELIFIEGHSTDDTWEVIQRVYDKYKNTHNIKITRQSGNGKADAVRKGFREAEGEIVTILDGDLTMPPEELPKFYNIIARRQADFVNGCRLVYHMEEKAMKYFNVLGNKFFSIAFTLLLDQPIKDTLCGTKMLLRKDYDNIVANRSYFGDFDPFGDFDLLFGAYKLNLKISEVPIRYKSRVYGETNIRRWRHGLILIKMVIFAMKKIKFV